MDVPNKLNRKNNHLSLNAKINDMLRASRTQVSGSSTYFSIKSNRRQFFLFFILLLFSCQSCQEEPFRITPAFYHWQTKLDLSATELTYLKGLNVQKIYPKFFDVDWDFNEQEAVAKASLIVTSDLSEGLEIVPTVFITNRTLVHLPKEKLPDLAKKIAQKLLGQLEGLPNVVLKEMQFDCDWSKSTQQKYFTLLKLLRKELQSIDIRFSATIRLHQIKYVTETGIPPVERGMLMYYNMGKVQEIATGNSILDNQIGQQYLANLKQYPLPLDLALPLFKWGVLFRDDKMIKLLNQLEEAAIADPERFRKVDENHWQVIKSTYLDGVYLYKNDEIRIEKVTFNELNAAAYLLQKQLKNVDRSIVFYHLDSMVIKDFELEQLNQILSKFDKMK